MAMPSPKQLDDNDQSLGSKTTEFLAISQLALKKKMIPQLLLSLSIISFVFSYVYSSFLTHYSPKFQHYFSAAAEAAADPYQLLSLQGMSKNYIFLICNGLLVFLAKTSGLVQQMTSSGAYYYELEEVLQRKLMGSHGLRAGTSSDHEKEELIINELVEDKSSEDEEFESKEKRVEMKKDQGMASNEIVIVNIAESEEGTDDDDEVDEDEPARCWMLVDGNYDDRVQYEQLELDNNDEKEEEEEEDDEELNKRIEEFIKRMKEEIMVNECSTESIHN